MYKGKKLGRVHFSLPASRGKTSWNHSRCIWLCTLFMWGRAQIQKFPKIPKFGIHISVKLGMNHVPWCSPSCTSSWWVGNLTTLRVRKWTRDLRFAFLSSKRVMRCSLELNARWKLYLHLSGLGESHVRYINVDLFSYNFIIYVSQDTHRIELYPKTYM